MRDIALAVIIFSALPFVLRRPMIGIVMLAWLGFMNPHRLCFGFMYSMPVVMIVTLFTMVGMLASREAKRIIWSRETTVLAIFVAWMVITTTQAFYPKLAAEQLEKVIKIQILLFMTLVMLTSRERLHIIVWTIVLSLGLYGVKGGIFTIVHGGAHRVQGPPGTFIEGNNEMALALVMTIPLMRYLHLHEQSRLIRQALLGAIVLTVVAAIGSQSRGAMVAAAITGTFFWWKSRHKVRTALLLGLAALIVLSIMPEAWYQRMNSINTYSEDASALGRINAWWTAWNVANRRLFGGGFEMWHDYVFELYAPDPNNVRDVHSIYFEVLGEQGWPGFILWATLLAMTWLKCRSISRMAKKRPDIQWAGDLALMIQVSMIGYMSAGAFLGLAYFDYIYYLIVVVVVAHHLVATEGDVPLAVEP